jgi:serine/threonine-protein kinase
MATVYLAHDLKHDRLVALKVLHPQLAATIGPERFEREIKLAARLQHPHIVTVYDSGDAAGQLWFTMPYVEGENLRDRLEREKQLPLEDALRIVREAALAPGVRAPTGNRPSRYKARKPAVNEGRKHPRGGLRHRQVAH